ncbi:hypothetical protein KAI78_07080 [bacterium]|nr:hypothetical protein [bacterium]
MLGIRDKASLFYSENLLAKAFVFTALLALLSVPLASSDKVMVKTLKGELHKGMFLHMSESYFMIWQSTSPYTGKNLDHYVKSLHFTEVDRIIIVKEGNFGGWAFTGLGFGLIMFYPAMGSGEDDFLNATTTLLSLFLPLIGLLIGAVENSDIDIDVGGDPGLYREIRKMFRDRSLCALETPGILQYLIDHSSTDPSLPSPSVLPIDRSRKSLLRRMKLHLVLSGGTSKCLAAGDMLNAFKSSGFESTESTSYPIDMSSVLAWNIALNYSINDRFRIGLVRSVFPFQWVSGSISPDEYGYGISYGLILDYVRHRVSPLLLSRVEVVHGVGVCYNDLTVHGDLWSHYSDPLKSFKVNKNIPGLLLKWSIAYYINKNMSIQFRVDGRIVPSVHVPSFTASIEHITGKIEERTLKEHNVNFSSLDLSLGICLHY